MSSWGTRNMDFIFHTQWQDFDNPMNDLLDKIGSWWVTSPPAKADDENPGMPIFPLYCEVLPEKIENGGLQDIGS